MEEHVAMTGKGALCARYNFDFIGGVGRYHSASDENAPGGIARMGNLIGRMRLRSVLVQDEI